MKNLIGILLLLAAVIATVTQGIQRPGPIVGASLLALAGCLALVKRPARRRLRVRPVYINSKASTKLRRTRARA